MKKITLIVCLLAIACPKLPGQSLPPYLSSSGLIAWYPFNSNAQDESGNGHHGVIGVSTVWATDRMGSVNSAYHFNGYSSNIISSDTFFDIGMHNYTISCWINSDSINNPHNGNNNQNILNTIPHNGMAISYNWGHTNKYSTWVNDNPTYASWNILGNAKSHTNITATTWKHIVLKKINDTGYHFYVNGVLDTMYHTTLSSITRHCKISMGRTDTTHATETFLGRLDDFAIYNRAISDSEIVNLYFAINGVSWTCVGSTNVLSSFVTGGTWSSSSTSIATVSTSGVVTGVAVGTVVISYTVGTITGTFPINILAAPPTGTISGHNFVCVSETDTLTDTTSGGSWAMANNRATISTSGVVAGNTAGKDTAYYIVSGPCGIDTMKFPMTVYSLHQCDSMLEVVHLTNSNNGITLYPNPSKGNFTVELTNCKQATITLFDIAGRIAEERTVNETTSQNLKYQIGHLLPGNYQLRVVSDGKTYRERITILE